MPIIRKTKLEVFIWLVLVIELFIAIGMYTSIYLIGGFWYATHRMIGILACLALAFQVLRGMARRKYNACSTGRCTRILRPIDVAVSAIASVLVFGLYKSSAPSVAAQFVFCAVFLNGFYHYWGSNEYQEKPIETEDH